MEHQTHMQQGQIRRREPAHPTVLTYVKVAVILGAITAVEFAVFYIEAIEDVFLAIFLPLSLAKFALVVMFYMHLKFDARLFSNLFVGGFLLALAVLVALLAMFRVFVQ